MLFIAALVFAGVHWLAKKELCNLNCRAYNGWNAIASVSAFGLAVTIVTIVVVLSEILQLRGFPWLT